MIIVFDNKDVIYQLAVPPKTTVKGEYCISVWKFLQYISRKHHEIIRNWTLLHKNARPHVATSIYQYLSKCISKIMMHSLCNSDFTLCNFKHWKRSSVAENLTKILKLFQQFRVLWSSFQEKASLLYFFYIK